VGEWRAQVPCQGGWLLPGIIDIHSHLGVGSYPSDWRGKADTNEQFASGVGGIQSMVRAVDGIDPEDPAIRQIRTGGVTVSQVRRCRQPPPAPTAYRPPVQPATWGLRRTPSLCAAVLQATCRQPLSTALGKAPRSSRRSHTQVLPGSSNMMGGETAAIKMTGGPDCPGCTVESMRLPYRGLKVRMLL
jgi:hypothetical protein